MDSDFCILCNFKYFISYYYYFFFLLHNAGHLVYEYGPNIPRNYYTSMDIFREQFLSTSHIHVGSALLCKYYSILIMGFDAFV
jgi:hypothetical protein